MSLSPPPSGIVLDDTHFDCLLLGTSLTNTLLAAALAKLGKKVLHIDRNDYYGGFDTSLAFNDFAQLLRSTTSAPAPAPAPNHSGQSALPSELVSEWIAICGGSDTQHLSFHHIAHSSPLYEVTSATFSSAAPVVPPEATTDPASNPSTSHPASASAADEADAGTSVTAAPPVTSSTTTVSSPPPSLPSSLSRQYSLDVTCRLLLSRSQLVELLIASSTASYVEFKAVDQSHLCPSEREGLQRVPVSRSAVFTSSLISVAEKRQLMRLLAAVMPNHKHRQLSARLTSFVAYAIALLDYRQDPTSSSSSSSSSGSLHPPPSSAAGGVTSAKGIGRMRRHFQSIGRYSVGAFLYPIYGMGELPQAFARLCAVHGGVYILRYQPLCVVSRLDEQGERTVKGVISDAGQLITADALVCDREYVEEDDDDAQRDDSGSVSCAACVVDGRVLSGAGEALDDLVQCVFPPLSVHDNPHPVRLVQLSGSVKAAPESQYVLYLSTPSTAASVSAEHDLQPVVDYVSQQSSSSQPPHADGADSSSSSSSRKPNLLHAFFYKRKQRPAVIPPAASANNLTSAGTADTSRHSAQSTSASSVSSCFSSFRGCRNVLLTGDSSPLLPLDSHLEAAQLLLDRLAPGTSLLAALTAAPRAHDSGGGGGGGDEERQQLEQLNILNSVIGSGGVHEDDQDDAATPLALADDDSKEQAASVAPPSILPRASEQQPEEQQQEREEHRSGGTSTGGAAHSAASDEDAVLESLDDLTFD